MTTTDDTVFWHIPRKSWTKCARVVAWRLACRLSNPVLRIHHRHYSGDAQPFLNSTGITDAYAMLSLCGWGCFRCYRRDAKGGIAIEYRKGVMHVLRTSRWGRVKCLPK